ncbi:GntR family transcriptional regulator [Mucisphaera calidilacus]|uniref:Arabinose metabolism transcriptional repressor n=1 Tax=Mucisphaera calidilacus TaxID=2527982 RepID=A0A518BU43_9BACT|nr:GntR family transcriptional regulator [Mucisphaera calidilacus]QDU70475.1 Arabinose metabolism transcriptional repressor [Mucisphaera calidilacus]
MPDNPPEPGILLVNQIGGDIRRRVRLAELSPGDKLPSMRQLSREYGCSVGTLQQAISALTREGLLDSSERKGVFVAQSSNRPRFIVLALASLDTVGNIVTRVQDAIKQTPYHLIILAAQGDFGDQVEMLDLLVKNQVAGVILCPPTDNRFAPAVKRFLTHGIPCVQATIRLDGIDVDAVVFDGVEAGRLAFGHLLKKGHRRIGYVDLGSQVPSFCDIRTGADMALREYGLRFSDLAVSYVEGDVVDLSEPHANGTRATQSLLAEHPDLTAVVGINPVITTGIARAVHESGRSVPKDVSVVAIGDDGSFALSRPQITAVWTRKSVAAGRAAVRLCQILDGDAGSPRVMQVMPRLVERNSVLDLTEQDATEETPRHHEPQETSRSQ